MNIKKSTFDNSPSLVENEGNVVRINFDIEQVDIQYPSTVIKDYDQYESIDIHLISKQILTFLSPKSNTHSCRFLHRVFLYSVAHP